MDSKNNELNEDFEEAHYHRTVDDFVELLVVYGFVAVIADVIRRIESTEC